MGGFSGCRIGHGFIGEYYNRFWREVLQAHEHLFCECPLYQDLRHILRGASRDLSLPEILGTKDGVEALAKFLEESGAFTKMGKARWET
ncbi:hypothetical protein B0H14DRAFT_2362035 [Mycena olivaceomarginata]|nr:hypothetical protein B0H14DRAFT_2362035 [Mycena olivaceomarginata]